MHQPFSSPRPIVSVLTTQSCILLIPRACILYICPAILDCIHACLDICPDILFKSECCVACWRAALRSVKSSHAWLAAAPTHGPDTGGQPSQCLPDLSTHHGHDPPHVGAASTRTSWCRGRAPRRAAAAAVAAWPLQRELCCRCTTGGTRLSLQCCLVNFVWSKQGVQCHCVAKQK